MTIQGGITAGIVAGTAQSLRISPPAIAWCESRGISPETLAQLNVASGTAFFPDLEKKLEAVFFRYCEGWKARAMAEKSFPVPP